MEGDKSSEGRGDGSAVASAVSSGDGSKSNVSSENRKAPTLDKKTFADQFEQRMQAKIEKEKEGDNGDLTKKAPDAPSPVKTHVICAAGHHCMADPEIAIDLINSPHECLNCYEKMHDPATCGEMFDEVEAIHGFAVHMLSENGQLKLREQVDASNLAICCMCIERFRLYCLLKGTTAETSTQAAKVGLEVIEGGPPAPIQDSIHQYSAKKKLNMELESVGDGDEAPKPSAYTAAAYEEMDAAIKRAVRNIPHMSPPVPPAAEARMAAMVEDTEIENKKKAFLSPDGVGGNGREPPGVLPPSADREQQNMLSEDPVQFAVSRAQAQQTAPIITRPPPRSMLPSNLKSTSSLPVIQATLVEDEPQAPVYDAIPLQSSGNQSVPWWKRRATLGMGCIIAVLVATFGAVVGSLRDGSVSTTSLAPPEKYVTIGGYVFNDEVMDETIPNIRVSVFACPSMDSSSSIANPSNSTLMVTRTNSTGYYMFRNAFPAGEYSVAFDYCVDQILPGTDKSKYVCYSGSSTWSGSGRSSHLDADNNVNPGTGVTNCMQYDEGGVYLNINAGMRYIQSSSTLLSSMSNTWMCHVAALDSRTSPTASTHQPYGFLFSIENDGAERVGLSALSVMLDSSSRVNFTLYLLDGPYITETGDDGRITGSAIGMGLSSQPLNSQSTSSNHTLWEEVARGENSNFVVDEDGATMIPFSSLAGGQTIGLEPGGINSFYLKMSGIALSVENGNGLVGEAVDELASVSSGVRSGLKLYVGRGVMIKDDWIDVTDFPANAFDALYSPARLIGKVWIEEACPHNYLTLKDLFWFYVSAPLGNEAQVERDIIGNVTEYYHDLFSGQWSFAYRDWGLSIADITEPLKANLIEKNADDDDRCIKDNKPENSANVCYGYALEIIFEHSRNIPQGMMSDWILGQSNDIRGNLVATQGTTVVTSDQAIVVTNVSSELNPDEELAYCSTISDELIESRYLLNYSIANVYCADFSYQLSPLITLRFNFFVIGEYRPDNSYWQPQEAAEKRNAFGNLVEDSINAEKGTKLITALREREVKLAEDSTAIAREIPSNSNRAQSTTNNQTPSENPTINDGYSTTGINRTTTMSIILGLLICMLILMAIFTYRECIRGREQAEEENSDEASS